MSIKEKKLDYNNGVLMVVGSFPPEITGGAINCNNLLKTLDPEKRRYFVIATCRKRDLKTEQDETWGKLFRIYINPYSKLSKLLCCLKIIKLFLEIHKRIKIVHLNGFSSKSIIFVLLAKLYNKKLIIRLTSLGDDDPASLEKRRWGRTQYLFYKSADIYISVSPGLSEAFMNSQLKNKSLLQIPNGIDTNRFRPTVSANEKKILRIKLNLPIDKKIILAVGFISKEKGIDVLYNSWKHLIGVYKVYPFLLIVGTASSDYFGISQELMNSIKADIRKNDLQDQIRLFELRQDIENYFRASDIFVMPSKREGFSLVLAEAMSCALPVIAARIKGVTDYLVTDKTDGLLFQSGNTDELSEKIFTILKDNTFASALGLSARRRVENEFELSKISSVYDKLYKELGQEQSGN